MHAHNLARSEIVDEIDRLIARLRALDGLPTPNIEEEASAPLWQGVGDLAGRLYRIRRLRDATFGDRLFADPGWDMLLDLFANGEGGVSVTSLCAASTRKPTSGLRALERLIDSGLVRRVSDNRDRRQILIVPTAKARTGMKSVYQRAVGLG